VSFLETVERARDFLERHRRVSLRALRRELALVGFEKIEAPHRVWQIRGPLSAPS